MPLALDEYVRAGKIRAGHRVLMEGVGGGFTWGATLATMLATAGRNWRSSPSLCVSSIHVENVVYEPTNAVPTSSARCGLSARPERKPSS